MAVLTDERYRLAARRLKKAIAEADGLNRAANVIEDSLRIGAMKRKPWAETVAAD